MIAQLPVKNADLSSESNEWYTPHKLLEAEREVLGIIELDPASCEIANTELVQAQRYFTQADNGLSQSWDCESFHCNPPGGKAQKNQSSAAVWWDKALSEYELGNAKCGIFVVFNPELMARRVQIFDYPVCIMKRKRFGRVSLDGKIYIPASPTKFNLAVLLPKNREMSEKFRQSFASLGRVIVDSNSPWS